MRLNMSEEKWYRVKDGEIPPIPKELFDLCVEETVDRVILSWEGGSDEGYLQVDIWLVGENDYGDHWERPDTKKAALRVLENKIEDWVGSCIEYNGAGEGSPYGHELTIDITNGKATLDEWWNERVEDNVFTDREVKLDGGEGQ